MDKYIHIDTLVDYIDWDNDIQKWTLRREPENIPTVNAVEVVHGQWLNWQGDPISPDDYWRVWRCSECKNEMEFDEAVDREDFSSNYCPNCGAKMDGGSDETD